MTYPSRKVLVVGVTGFALALFAALTVDQSLSIYFRQPEMEPLWLKARAITNVGLSQYYFALALFLYIFARWIRPQYTRVREWARDLFCALILSGILVHICKFSFGRQRPHKTEDLDPYVFHPFTTHWDFHSFASGHSQTMFTVATLFAVAFPKARWFFFLLAAFFSFTRVIVHDHFLSDVIGGATLGYIGAVTAIYLTHKKLRLSAV